MRRMPTDKNFDVHFSAEETGRFKFHGNCGYSGTTCDPKPLIIAERYKFHKAEEEQSESVWQYLADLRKLAETCKLALYREEAIRERFVCGLRLQLIQPKLLPEATLTLHTAVQKACATELTEKEESGFHGDFYLDVKEV